MRWSYPSLLMSRIEHCNYLSSCFLTDHYIIVKTGYHATKLISIKLVPNLCTKIYNSAYRYAMSNPVNTALRSIYLMKLYVNRAVFLLPTQAIAGNYRVKFCSYKNCIKLFSARLRYLTVDFCIILCVYS